MLTRILKITSLQSHYPLHHLCIQKTLKQFLLLFIKSHNIYCHNTSNHGQSHRILRNIQWNKYCEHKWIFLHVIRAMFSRDTWPLQLQISKVHNNTYNFKHMCFTPDYSWASHISKLSTYLQVLWMQEFDTWEFEVGVCLPFLTSPVWTDFSSTSIILDWLLPNLFLI